MIPATVTPVPAIPRTSAGKVDRAALLSLPVDQGTDAAGAPPQGELEIRIAAVWTALFDCTVARSDNFFAPGGNSLLAVTMAQRLSAELGVSVPARALFAAPTLAAFARRLADLRDPTPSSLPSLMPLRTATSPPKASGSSGSPRRRGSTRAVSPSRSPWSSKVKCRRASTGMRLGPNWWHATLPSAPGSRRTARDGCAATRSRPWTDFGERHRSRPGSPRWRTSANARASRSPWARHRSGGPGWWQWGNGARHRRTPVLAGAAPRGRRRPARSTSWSRNWTALLRGRKLCRRPGTGFVRHPPSVSSAYLAGDESARGRPLLARDPWRRHQRRRSTIGRSTTPRTVFSGSAG